MFDVRCKRTHLFHIHHQHDNECFFETFPSSKFKTSKAHCVCMTPSPFPISSDFFHSADDVCVLSKNYFNYKSSMRMCVVCDIPNSYLVDAVNECVYVDLERVGSDILSQRIYETDYM